MFSYQFLEAAKGITISSQKVKLVLLGTDGTLEPSKRIRSQQVFHATMGYQEFLSGRGEPLTKSGDLGSNVVATPHHRQAIVLSS
tara:strand:+ start:717 stop:971 length:255 start_codon:yes stop_codon:yes gene_type:complete